MYHYLLTKLDQEYADVRTSVVKNTLLVVALLLSEKTVGLWKLKGAVGRVLGNTETAIPSHYQRLKRWLRPGEDKHLWVGMLQASACLLHKHYCSFRNRNGKVELLRLIAMLTQAKAVWLQIQDRVYVAAPEV